MKTTAAAALSLSLLAAIPPPAAGETAAEAFAALLREYRTSGSGFREATTDLERREAVEAFGTFSPRFVQLAAAHPKDPVALKALREAIQAVGSTDSLAQVAWEMNRAEFPSGGAGGEEAVRGAIELLSRDHFDSDQLDVIGDRMRYGYRMEYAAFLHKVAQSSPHREVRAGAGLDLARFLESRLEMLRLVADRPELARRIDDWFGAGYLRGLRQVGPAGLTRQIETALEAASAYDDVPARGGGTVAQAAQTHLYNLRHLAPEKAAPETGGPDQHGERFQLSDYRGQVVLLHFWMEL